MNCANCLHWTDDTSWRVGQESEVRMCGRIKMFWDSTDWDVAGNKRVFKDDSLAFAQDGSDYSAYLLTKPEFYCNMWEAQ
jgi:hypothetical protein